MNFSKWLLVAAGIAGTVHLWHGHQRAVIDHELSVSADSSGFVPVATPADATPDEAIILAALNCPSAQAKRADAMAMQLGQMGIPNRRTNSYVVSNITREQMPLLKRTNAVLSGEIPIVIINGMAKANPSVDEVVAEYRRNK